MSDEMQAPKKTCAQVAAEFLKDCGDLASKRLYPRSYWIDQFKACSDFPREPLTLNFEAAITKVPGMDAAVLSNIPFGMAGKRFKFTAVEILGAE